MKELFVANMDKIVPAAQSVCGRLGNYLGDVLNDAINKTVEEVVKIVMESPMTR